MNKLNLFFDSVIIQLSSQTTSIHQYYQVVRLLSKHFHLINPTTVPREKLAKYSKSYIVRDSMKNFKECLSVFSCSTKLKPYGWFVVYARKEGVYIELHGFMQYTDSFIFCKLQVLHLLYKNFFESFSLSRLDVAIDLRARFKDVVILNKNSESLQINKKISSARCHYYDESTQARFRRSRIMKCYDKTFQRSRSYPLPFFLTRIEVIIRRSKLKFISDAISLQQRLVKELSNYHIFVGNDEIIIDENHINKLCLDFFQILQNGKNILYYSNIYKNIKKQSDKAKLSYECFKNGCSIPFFATNHNISTKTLRKNINFFRRFKNEQ
jgi:hypothetical protein